MSTDKKLARRDEQTLEKTESRRTVAPPVDVYENEQEILLLADVPGADKSQLAVQFDRDQLSIKAPRHDTASGSLLAGEYGVADYARSFVMPVAIDAERITAELDRGVLKVHLPKAASARPRQITVTSA